MTYRLIYKSTASPDVTDEDFRTIAMFSSLSNKRHDISGLLLHYEGQIMQVLEGPEEHVKALYKKIEQDPRHFDVSVIMSRECETNLFTEWSMGYRPVDSEALMGTFFELTKENLDSAMPDFANDELRQVIGNFAAKAGIS